MLRDIRTKLFSVYQQDPYRRAIKVLIIGLVGAIWIFSRVVTSLASTEEIILALLVLVLFSMESLETDTYRIEELLASQTRVLGEHRDLKTQVELLMSEKPDRLHILGYSGSSALIQSIIEEATNRGARVYLLYQHPSYTYNQKELDLTVDTIQYLYRFHKMDDTIQLRFYTEPASVMGIRSDDGVTLGWYTYSDYREELDSPNRAVQGPENEALLFPVEDRRQYPVMDEYFTELYTYLWLGGQPVEAVYEGEDCPEELRRWVDNATERDREKIEAWFQRTAAEEITNRDDLFPDHEPMATYVDE